jgi:predicted nucleic acid-binding protein
MNNSTDSDINANPKTKIAIDSNIFRNSHFINYLKLNKASLEVFIPSIVYLEVAYYYLRKGITWADFLEDIKKFEGVFLDWKSIVIEEVIKNAIANKTNMPFRHHIRDFLIGTQCEALKISLVSYNKNHFNWLHTVSVLTPEEFIQRKI